MIKFNSRDSFKDNLLNDCLKCEKYLISNVKDGFDVDISVGLKTGYVNLAIDYSGADNLKLFVGDVLIDIVTGNAFKSYTFEVSSVCKIYGQGDCDKLCLSLSGGVFLNIKKEYLLPMTKGLVEVDGDKCKLYTYVGVDDFVGNSIVYNNQFENVVDIQNFSSGGSYLNGILFFDNGLYFCNNMINYTERILIDELAKNGVIVPIDDEKFCVVYIADGLKYKICNNGVWSESKVIHINNSRKPIDFVDIEVYQQGMGAFVVKWENGDFAIFLYENNAFIQKHSINSKFVKVMLFEKYMIVCGFNRSRINLSWFEFIKGKSIELLKGIEFKVVNADNIFCVDNKMLVSNNGYFSELKNYEI